MVCTILYIAVVVVLTGLVRWDTLVDDAAPVVNTLKKLHFTGVRLVVLLGALMGMISSLLVFCAGSSARHGLPWFPRWTLPEDILGRVRIRASDRKPRRFPRGWRDLSWVFRRDCWILERWPIYRILERYSRSRWLPAEALILRYREPERHRAFRAPGGPLAPIITIFTCLLLMAGLRIMGSIWFFCLDDGGVCGVYSSYWRRRRNSTLNTANSSVRGICWMGAMRFSHRLVEHCSRCRC